MKLLFNFLTIAFLLIAVTVKGQMWKPSNATNEPIYYKGNVGIGIEEAPMYRLVLKGDKTINFNTNRAATAGIRSGSAISYTGNMTLFSEDGINGEGIDINYWNGQYYQQALRVNNVTSGFSDLLLMKDGGRVGIGTGSLKPKAGLDISQDGLYIEGYNRDINKYWQWKALELHANNGNYGEGASIDFTNKNGNLARLSAYGQGEGKGGSLYFMTSNNHSYEELKVKMVVLNTGEVGIGTTTPTSTLDVAGNINFTGNIKQNGNTIGIWAQSGNAINYTSGDVTIGNSTNIPASGYKLNVWGKIRANEVVVNTDGADFVFEPSYKLRPLTELEAFIKQNKHLPEITPASEMKANGANLSELNTKLLQKVEELTLYLIEQNKKNEEQQKQILELKEAINKLLNTK